MNRCEHGQKITKFCITEHCHHKEAAGCDYCMKRYHFHLTNTLQLTEPNIEDVVKKLTLPTDSKFKTRILQEASIQYLRSIKNTLNNWFDQAQNAIADRLSHPMLRKQGLLPTYNRLKYREYRKINAKELRGLNEFAKNSSSEELKKEEVTGYFEEVQWAKGILEAAERIATEMVKLPQVKDGEGPITIPSKNKTKEVLDSIGREMNKRHNLDKVPSHNPNGQSDSGLFKGSSLMRRREGNNEKPGHSQVPSILVPKEEEGKKVEGDGLDVLNNVIQGEEKEKKKRKLERRRSSIDETIDLKFRADVNEKAKDIEDRKKRLLENIGVKKEDDDDRIVGQNLLDMRFGKIDSKKEETGSMERSGSSKDEGSHEKFNLGLGFIGDLIENILPPLVDVVGPKKSEEPIQQKTVNIPVTKEPYQEIQSPIWKKRNQASKAEGSGFGITLNKAYNTDNRVVDEIREKQVEVDKIAREAANIKKEKEDDVIVLGLNEKYSLLLFSEALKCESQKAIELLKASLKYSPNNLSAAEYLSYLYLEGGRAKECLEVCESILLKIEDTPEEFQLTLHLHNNRAAALNMLGRYSESIMVLQKCLRSRRKNYFYKNLADAYFSLGIPEKASMNYEKAVKLDTQYDEAYYNLAVTQFMQEEYTSALMNIGYAVKIDPENETYLQLQVEIKKRKANINIVI